MWLLRVPRANCAHLSSYPSIEIWRYLWIYQQTTMVNSYQDIKVLLAKFCWNLIFSEIHRGRLTAGTYKSPMKRKEHDLNQTSMIMFQPLIFQGCMSFQQLPLRTMTSSFIQALQPQRRKKTSGTLHCCYPEGPSKIVEPYDHRLDTRKYIHVRLSLPNGPLGYHYIFG